MSHIGHTALDTGSSRDHALFPFSRFYEELGEEALRPALIDVPTLPVRVAVPVADGVLPAPVVVVGPWDAEAVVRVARARRAARALVPIAPYEELIVDPDPALLEETLPSPLLARADVTPTPARALPAAPPVAPVAARDRWDADEHVDEVIQDWFDRPPPPAAPETGGEIPLD